MATCTQFTTAQLKGLTFKLQCCLGQVAKKYARLRAAGRYDLAKCVEYDLKYLTLAFNALNCIDSLDITLTLSNDSPPSGNGQTITYTTVLNHNLQVGQLISVLGYTQSAYNVTLVPILAITSPTSFVTQGAVSGVAKTANATVTSIVNNSLSCDDIQSILNKVKSICDCDCCLNDGESTYKMTYDASTGQLTAGAL